MRAACAMKRGTHAPRITRGRGGRARREAVGEERHQEVEHGGDGDLAEAPVVQREGRRRVEPPEREGAERDPARPGAGHREGERERREQERDGGHPGDQGREAPLHEHPAAPRPAGRRPVGGVGAEVEALVAEVRHEVGAPDEGEAVGPSREIDGAPLEGRRGRAERVEEQAVDEEGGAAQADERGELRAEVRPGARTACSRRSAPRASASVVRAMSEKPASRIACAIFAAV